MNTKELAARLDEIVRDLPGLRAESGVKIDRALVLLQELDGLAGDVERQRTREDAARWLSADGRRHTRQWREDRRAEAQLAFAQWSTDVGLGKWDGE
jgi:hypothetical protein